MPQTISISSLQDGLSTAIGEVSEFVTEHPIGVAAGTAGVVALGAGLVVAASVKSKRKTKRKSKKKAKRVSKRKGRKLKFGSKAFRKKYCGRTRARRKSKKQRKPYTAYCRRDTSHRRIRYTKNNQPYVILASGKARFISKKSVRQSRRRKGGRY